MAGFPARSARPSRGIAINECYGTIVGEVVEISINSQGELKVEKKRAYGGRRLQRHFCSHWQTHSFPTD
jgi:hypothetical protein